MWRGLYAVVLFAGLGLAVVAGYVFVFAYRAEQSDWLCVQLPGQRITGPWGGMILGAGFLSSLGCGLFALGLTWLLVLGRARRPLLWGLLIVLAVGGLGGYGLYLLDGRTPSLTRVTIDEQERAEEVILLYQQSLRDDLITDDFRRRLAARQELTAYTGQWGWELRRAAPDEVKLTGYVLAEGKTVWTSAAGAARRKGDFVAFPEPQRVNYTAIAKKKDGVWLVDDFEYED
jgi:hypothetical protein